jgi:hypothetical protein
MMRGYLDGLRNRTGTRREAHCARGAPPFLSGVPQTPRAVQHTG